MLCLIEDNLALLLLKALVQLCIHPDALLSDFTVELLLQLNPVPLLLDFLLELDL